MRSIHGLIQLSVGDVIEVLSSDQFVDINSQDKLGKMYGLSQTRVSAIIREVTYKGGV